MTDPDTTLESQKNDVNLDPDYIAWQKKKTIDAKLDKMVAEKPEFKDIVDAGLREKLHKIPQILEITALWEETVADFTKKVMESAKKKEAEAEALKLKPATDAKPDVNKASESGAQRPITYSVAEGFDPKKHFCPALESDENLRKMGFKEEQIAVIKTFG